MADLVPATGGDREAATSFVGRVARWDPAELVRLVRDDDDDAGVTLWARAAFGVLASRSIRAHLDVPVTTAYAVELLGGLAVSTRPTVATGDDVGAQWHARLPPADGWTHAGELSVAVVLDRLADGTRAAREFSDAEQRLHPRPSTKATVSPRLLDRVALTVDSGDTVIPVPLRLLFALSGMGLLDEPVRGPIDVWVTPSWMRLATVEGDVTRRRLLDLTPGESPHA